jgi:hypothetical protein
LPTFSLLKGNCEKLNTVTQFSKLTQYFQCHSQLTFAEIMFGRKAQNNRSLFPIKSMDRFEICLGFKYIVYQGEQSIHYVDVNVLVI